MGKIHLQRIMRACREDWTRHGGEEACNTRESHCPTHPSLNLHPAQHRQPDAPPLRVCVVCRRRLSERIGRPATALLALPGTAIEPRLTLGPLRMKSLLVTLVPRHLLLLLLGLSILAPQLILVHRHSMLLLLLLLLLLHLLLLLPLLLLLHLLLLLPPLLHHHVRLLLLLLLLLLRLLPLPLLFCCCVCCCVCGCCVCWCRRRCCCCCC